MLHTSLNNTKLFSLSHCYLVKVPVQLRFSPLTSGLCMYYFLSRCIIQMLQFAFSMEKMTKATLMTFCSHPPLLSSMIFDIYNRGGDVEFVKSSLPALLKEYEFWNSGAIDVFSFSHCCIFSCCFHFLVHQLSASCSVLFSELMHIYSFFFLLLLL